MSQLHMSLLGAPVVKHGEHTLTFSTRKALALLAYLAVEGEKHTRKTLSEAFWPELDAAHGRAALRATLLELRNLLDRSHGPGEQTHLQIERDVLAIEQGNPPIVDLGLVEAVSKHTAEALADEARGALLAQLEQATQLARGPFLAGFTLRDSQFFDDWARQQREYWHLRIHQLFDSLSRLYERTGERERAIATIYRWLGFDPLAEEGYRRLMRLRFALGDRAGALRAYATCRDVLADELQVEPEPETMALAERVRHTAPICRSSSQAPPFSAGQALTRLLDGPLLGRSAEFGTLIERYQRVHARQPHLVLLQGTSGIGKTRLASEFVGWAQAQGADVLAGRVLHTGRQLPYQPWIDLLRRRLEQEHAPDEFISDVWLAELSRLLPELHDRFPELPVSPTDEELGHHRLFEAIARLFRRWAARRPLVLWLDDLQWADTGTLDLLLYLARSLAEQPAPVLLLLNLRTGTQPFSDLQTTWLLALKRTRIPLTALRLAVFTREETRHFVQALAWAEQPIEVEKDRASECSLENRGPSTGRAALVPFADWLYAQTWGQPFCLVETLKGLLEREILLPSLQKNGAWGLILRAGRLTRTAVGELIPSSVRELIGSQLGRLSAPAWAFLVAAAVMGTGLTFERLCQVAQVEELAGLHALEELVRSGLLCEGKRMEEAQAFDGYSFPGEMMREVVYQEAGATRQRFVQRRVSLVMQEEAENDLSAGSGLLQPTPINGHAFAEIRNEQGRRVVAGAANRGMGGHHRAATAYASDVTRRNAGNRHRRANPAGSAGSSAAGQAVFTLPRSPPDGPASVFWVRAGTDRMRVLVAPATRKEEEHYHGQSATTRPVKAGGSHDLEPVESNPSRYRDHAERRRLERGQSCCSQPRRGGPQRGRFERHRSQSCQPE